MPKTTSWKSRRSVRPMRKSCVRDCGGTGRVYLEDVRSGLFHDVCEAEKVK